MRFGAYFVVLLAGCARSPGTAPTRPLRDYRGIIHCHSKFSHDSKGTYEEILSAAKAAKVDFVCITDHPPEGDPGLSLREGWRGLRDGVLFIQGHELAGTNLLALGIREPVEGESPADRIDHIRRQGGVSIVSHPEEVTDWEPYLGADGMEIYNVHAAFTRLRKDPGRLAAALKAVREDPERSFLHVQELDPAVIARWDEVNQSRRFVGIAGNDSHQNVNILGLQLDPYPRAFKFVSTHVYAEDLSQEAVLGALRKGRCTVVFDVLGSPDSFVFGVGACCLEKEEALRRGIVPGTEEVAAGRGDSARPVPMELAFDLPATQERVRIGMPSDEKPFGVATKGIFHENVWMLQCFRVPPGIYRVVLRRKAGEQAYPWILSNPVYVRPERP
jgi:hypothetical protein